MQRARTVCTLITVMAFHANFPLLDRVVMRGLDKLISLHNNHEELCYLAYQMRDHSFEALLQQRSRRPSTGPIWRAIRHYVGRLGSWWSACTVLVSVAESDARIFLDCQVKAVPKKATTAMALSQHGSQSSRPETTDGESLDATISAVYLCGGGTGSTFADRLAQRKSRTYIHAELLVLNHFYRRRFAFSEGVPYIGCSKLSCYCCHVYMDLHPQAVLPRPCHGNTWTRWAMPTLRVSRRGTRSNQDMRLLADLVGRMQQEITMSTSSTAIDKQLESTTGISEECRLQRV